jgi:hypothetical protein
MNARWEAKNVRLWEELIPEADNNNKNSFAFFALLALFASIDHAT